LCEFTQFGKTFCFHAHTFACSSYIYIYIYISYTRYNVNARTTIVLKLYSALNVPYIHDIYKHTFELKSCRTAYIKYIFYCFTKSSLRNNKEFKNKTISKHSNNNNTYVLCVTHTDCGWTRGYAFLYWNLYLLELYYSARKNRW